MPNEEYLLKIKERLENLYASIPQEAKDGKYDWPGLEEYNSLKSMFVGLGKITYNDNSLTFEQLLETLEKAKGKTPKV